MTIHTVRTSVLGLRGAPREIWNAGPRDPRERGFGLGIWLAPEVFGRGADPFFVLTGGPETPLLAAALFLVGRLWVGRDGRELPWAPHVSESILLGIGVGLLGRFAGRAYEMVAAYLPVPTRWRSGCSAAAGARSRSSCRTRSRPTVRRAAERPRPAAHGMKRK
jgi:hypothetical protein